MSEVPEKIQEAAADVISEVGSEADQIAQHTANIVRHMTKAKIQFTAIGYAMGATSAALLAWRIAYSRAETKYSKIADAEIEKMREHYSAKRQALEAENAKGDLEEIVKERGYSSPDEETNVAPPMAVPPPTSARTIEAEDKAAGEPPDDEGDAETRNIFEEAAISHEWNWHAERSRRSPMTPYVIHADEVHEFETYQEATLTYYEADDVLCDGRDEIIGPEDRDRLIGEKNLERFGHGSKDASVVYIRNDTLEIMYEVVKSPNSYAEEVHGLKHEDYNRGNIRRMRMRERDE